MARVVKDYDERYDEFLSVAAQLFYSKGYDQTSVRAIIDAVGVAKGTFYHYFDAKVDLLDALVMQQVDTIVAMLQPLVDDPEMGALEKLNQFFGRINTWKLARKDLMLETARVLYRDENVLLREKLRVASMQRVPALLAEILRQGQQAGVFAIEHPEETAELLIVMASAVAQTMTRALLTGALDAALLARIQRQAAVYDDGIARILGVEAGALQTFAPDDLESWLDE